ncbi:hypothetical protein AB1N83_001835 [Pleurotus pulmonarius]
MSRSAYGELAVRAQNFAPSGNTPKVASRLAHISYPLTKRTQGKQSGKLNISETGYVARIWFALLSYVASNTFRKDPSYRLDLGIETLVDLTSHYGYPSLS